jgi:hypothetical protein
VTRLRDRRKLVASAAVVAVAAVSTILSLTACSSSDSGDSETTPGEQAALDFARCMRENGVPNFPDPVAQPDGSFRLQRPPGVSPSALDDALKSCMRENGIPEFPDPKPGSDALSGLHGLFSNFDLESPRVARALQSCQSVVNQLLAPVHGGGS